MIKHTIAFSIEDAKRVFETAGLQVYLKQMDIYIHSDDEPDNVLDVWFVKNPLSGEDVLLEIAFKDFLAKRNKQLFLQDVSKLDVYNLFR